MTSDRRRCDITLMSCARWDRHTCDEFESEMREIFLPFQGGFSKMYRICKKIPDSFQGDFEFCSKSGTL